MPTKFPAVTICNNDAFTTSNAQNLYEEIAKESGLKLFTNQVNSDLNSLVRIKAANPSYGDENRRKLGFEKSLILSCKFNEKKCINDLHWYYSFEYGNCWQFNVGLNLTNHPIDLRDLTLEGKEYGLSVVIFPLLYTQNKYMTNWDSGMVVFVHNSSFK